MNGALEQIRNLLIPLPSQVRIKEIVDTARAWSETVAQATEKFHEVSDSCDKVASLNSQLIGLAADSLLDNVGFEEEDKRERH